MFEVEPWGDDRSDLRSAVNTAWIRSAQGATTEIEEMERLRFYLDANQPQKELSPAQQRELLEG